MKASKHYLELAYHDLEKIENGLQTAADFLYDRQDIAKLEQSERYHVIKRKVSEIIDMLDCTLAIEDVRHYLPF